MHPRTIWIVDGAYVFSAAPGKMDYVKLKAELEKLNGGAFYESYYLNSTQESPTEAEQSFHTWLKTAPPQGPKMRVQLYKLKNLHVKCPQCATPFDRHVQKGVDVGIATLMIRLATQNLLTGSCCRRGMAILKTPSPMSNPTSTKRSGSAGSRIRSQRIYKATPTRSYG